jgi:hypothetical protein
MSAPVSLPEGVTAATLTAKATKTTASSPITISISITPSEDLTHLASGDKLSEMIETLVSGPGRASTFVVPHSSQAGFVDEDGEAVSKWYYIATVTSLTPTGSSASAPRSKAFLLPAGTTTVELETLPLHRPIPADEPDIPEWELPRRLSPEALSDTVSAAVAPKLDKLGTKTDTSAGLFDWSNNAASGYLFHLRSGALSTSATAAIGIGTDLGAGNGILMSHKNTGIGILATGQPGSGRIAEFTSRGSGSGFWINVQSGGGAAQINARDGSGFADGVANGTTTFTSATAAFVAGDVGKTITQLTSRGTTDPFGCIPAGTTIASVTNSTTVVLSQASTASGTAVIFSIAGRIPLSTQSLLRIMDTDLTTEIAKFTRGGATFTTADVATTPVRVNAKTGQTADVFQVYDGAAVKVFSLTNQGGLVAGVLSTFTNGGLLGAPVSTMTSFSSHPAIRAGRSGAVTGDNFQAVGGGSTPLSRFNKDGYFMTAKTAAPADADVSTGEAALWFDSTNGAAKLMIKAKQADGTVKTGSVTLA